MNLNTLLNEFIDSLEKEILKKKKRARNKPIILKDGHRVSYIEHGVIYTFEDFNRNVMPDLPVVLEILDTESNDGSKYDAMVIGVEDETLTLYIADKNLPDPIEKSKLLIDDTKLLENTKETIIKIRDSQENPPRILADKAFGLCETVSAKGKAFGFPENFNESQKEAVQVSTGSDVTFIWGPPGTGKSQTLGSLAEALLKDNNTLLITAHTNEAVDGLMEKIIKLFDEEQIKQGQIIRWKISQSKKLMKFTPSAIISSQSEELIEQEDNLEQRRRIAEENLRNIENSCNNYMDKLNILSSTKLKMQACEKDYNESRNILETQQRELLQVSTNVKSKETDIERLNKKNIIIKFFNKIETKKEKMLSELLDLKEKEALQRSHVDDQVKDSATKKNKFNLKKEEYENLYAELIFCEISEEELKRLVHNFSLEEEKIRQIDKEIAHVQKELSKIKERGPELLKNARVVGTTLTSCTLNPQLRERTFNVVIVDEVSMAPCPNLYASCALATDKAILCGDFYQLSPIAEDPDAIWLKNSIFDQCGITEKVINDEKLEELVILDTQYRCHPDIANSIIDIVYKGKLKNGLDKNHNNFYAQYLDPYPNEACILIDTSKVSTISNPWCVKKESSWISPNSAELALKLTECGLKSGIESVGIITPYNAQAKYIKREFESLHKEYPDKKIEAATVHKYQGREMDMIIFDLIDAPGKNDLAPFLKGVHGSEAMRLINVATTRARGKLIVIANVNFIERILYKEQNYILYQWIQHLKTKDCYICL